jgi:hypothetical protein
MRRGYEGIIENAMQEAEYAVDCAKDLTSEVETRKLWRAWSGMLDHYVKAVSAMRRATDEGKSKGWSDSLLAEQRRDPFLQYAVQARDHAAHVFESAREAEPSSVSLGNFIKIYGNSNVTLKGNVVVDSDGRTNPLPDGTIFATNGRYRGGSIPKSLLTQQDHYVVVSDVKTRSGIWTVPNLSTPPERRAKEIAAYVCEWLQKKIKELEALAKDNTNNHPC